MTARVKIPRRRPKYGNTACVGSDGFRYDSKAERAYGEQLLAAQKHGAIRLVLRQVPFYLQDKVKLTLDFVWIDADGVMHFEDVKSKATADETAFKLRKRLVEHAYNITIDVVMGAKALGTKVPVEIGPRLPVGDDAA